MTSLAIVAVLATCVTSAVVMLRLRSMLGLVMSLTATLSYAIRHVLLATGFDTLHPDELFLYQGTAGLITSAGWMVALWQATVTAAVAVTVVLGRSRRHRRPPPAPTSRYDWSTAALVLTALSALVMVLLSAYYGSPAAAQRALRVSDVNSGFGVLVVLPSAATVACVAWFRRARDEGRNALAPVVLGGVDAMVFYGFGSRAGALAAVIGFALAAADAAGLLRLRRLLRPRALLALVVLVAVVGGGAVGLRSVRDANATRADYSDYSVVRRVSTSLNLTYFDALVLARRDWPARYELRGASDISRGLSAAVPRALWPGKPVDNETGKWFRRTYEPTREGGWPLGAVGEWYVAFGWAGLLSAAAVSGWLAVRLEGLLQRLLGPGVGRSVAALVGLTVFPTGLLTNSPSRALPWLLAPLATARLARLVLPRATRPPAEQRRPALL